MNKRDYDYLDKTCEKLKFFSKYSKATRISLLKLANVVFYPENSIIFE